MTRWSRQYLPEALVVPSGHLLPSGGHTNLWLHFRVSGPAQSSTATSDKAFEDWLNEDLGAYQG